jgi:hypothetical protein
MSYEKLKIEIVKSENSNIEISALSDAEQTTLENDPENALLVIALISACECSKGTIGAFTHKNRAAARSHRIADDQQFILCKKRIYMAAKVKSASKIK